MQLHIFIKTSFLLAVSSLFVFGCSQQVETSLVEITSTPSETPTPIAIKYSGENNLVFISIEENGFAHLFIHNPQTLPLTRIVAGSWNDTSPALSPDRNYLAFASDRSGFWDLYVMELKTGEIRQVTNTPQYDSAPSWSPDSQWLTFETYINENLEVAIVSVNNPSQETLLITQHPASDHSPVWAPDGRNVAFISTRGGDSDVWLANLDESGDARYKNLSNTPFASENHPVWNYDDRNYYGLPFPKL